LVLYAVTMARRWSIIAAWFLSASLGWVILCNGAMFLAMLRTRLPDWCNAGYIVVYYVGYLAIPVVVTLLAMRRRLPETRFAIDDKRSGFAVEIAKAETGSSLNPTPQHATPNPH
jgi:hypothetical protein